MLRRYKWQQAWCCTLNAASLFEKLAPFTDIAAISQTVCLTPSAPLLPLQQPMRLPGKGQWLYGIRQYQPHFEAGCYIFALEAPSCTSLQFMICMPGHSTTLS